MKYDPTRKWDIALTDITLPNNNEHILYLKLPLEDGLATSEFIVDEDHIDPLRDDGFVIYRWGTIGAVVNGVRHVKMLWNNSVGNVRIPKVIPFVNTSTPTIPNYNEDFASIYGQHPRLDIIVIDEDGNEWERKLDSIRHKTDGLITHITYDLAENFTGYIIIS